MMARPRLNPFERGTYQHRYISQLVARSIPSFADTQCRPILLLCLEPLTC